MDAAFKSDIEKATRAVISEIGSQLRAEHAAILDAEKARFRDALKKLTD